MNLRINIIAFTTLLYCIGNLVACQTQVKNQKVDNNNINTINQVSSHSVDIKIEELMSQYNIPGVNVAIIKDGQLNSTRKYGLIQKGKADIVNEETMFSVGSISKVVNAFLTLKLVEEGKLKLDEDINQYLTESVSYTHLTLPTTPYV